MKRTLTKCFWLLNTVAITASLAACEVTPFSQPNNPALATKAYDQGVRLVGDRQYQGALESFADAIRLDPKSARAYAWRAYVYNILGNTSAALSDLDSAIQLDPNLVQAYNTRARIRYLSQDYKSAIADSTKAIALSPQDGAAYSARAFSYVRQKEYQKAIEDLTAALKVKAKTLPKEESAAIYGYRGICNLALKNYDAAIKDCTTSISFDSEVPQAYVARGQAYKQLGKSGLAKKDMDKYEQLAKAAESKQPPPRLVPVYVVPNK